MLPASRSRSCHQPVTEQLRSCDSRELAADRMWRSRFGNKRARAAVVWSHVGPIWQSACETERLRDTLGPRDTSEDSKVALIANPAHREAAATGACRDRGACRIHLPG